MRVGRDIALVITALLLIAACSAPVAANPATELPSFADLPTGGPTLLVPANTPLPSAGVVATETVEPWPASPAPASRPPLTPAPITSAPAATSPATATATATAPPATPAPAATRLPAFGSAPTGPTEEARVVRVVDGDTIRVAIGGIEYPVRYIGIDTPETVHPSKPVEWLGNEASDANRALVEGRTVILEKDVSETDRYGRLLRYVWLTDGAGWLLVNRELVRLGFAQASTYPPDVKYADLFLGAQRAARDNGLGLWGDPPPEDDDADEDHDPGGNGGRCDSSYPGVCIPPAPPDLDCGEISYRNFDVIGPDPHRFDGDNDGIGCET